MFDVAGARRAGYSDDEIADHLGKSGSDSFDIAGARKAGYSSKEILDHIGGQPSRSAAPKQSDSFIDAVQQGASSFVSGAGKTLKHYSPFQDTAASLEKTGQANAPAGYQSERVVADDGSVNLKALPNRVGEALPGMAAGLTAARALARLTPLGRIASTALGIGGTAAATQLGENTEQRAVADGEDPQNPSLKTKAASVAGTGASALVDTVTGTRYLPGGAGIARNVGMKGVGDAAKRAGKTAAVDATGETIQSVIEQTAETLGTKKGLTVNPMEALDAGAVGAAASPVFSGRRAVQEAQEAVKYRNVDTEVAPIVADDLAKHGGNVKTVEKNYRVNLAKHVKALRKETPYAAEDEPHGVLTRAVGGAELSAYDFNVLENAAAGNASGDKVVDLAKRLSTLQELKKTGTVKDDGRMTGGLSSRMENAFWQLKDPTKAGMLGMSSLLGAHLNPALMSAAPATLAALAGTYGISRVLDKAMGNRDPVKKFVNRFGGQGNAPASADVPEPVAPQAPQGPQPYDASYGPDPRKPYDPYGPGYNARNLPAVMPPPPRVSPNWQAAQAPQEPQGPTINMPPDPQRMLPPGGEAIYQGPENLAALADLRGPAQQWPGNPDASAIEVPYTARQRDNEMRKLRHKRAQERELVEPIGPPPMTPEYIKTDVQRLMAKRALSKVAAPPPPAAPEPEAQRQGEYTMLDEQTDAAVMQAAEAGADTVGAVRKVIGEDISPLEVKASLKRLADDGKIKREGAALTLVTAKAKAKPEPKTEAVEQVLPTAVEAPKPAPAPAPEPKPTPPVVAAKMKVEAQTPVAQNDDDLEIPDFLRRFPKKEEPIKVVEPKAEKPKRYASIEIARTEHPVDDVEKTIKAATDSWLQKNPWAANGSDKGDKGKASIERITREKFAIRDALVKEVHDLDADDFMAMLYNTRSFAGGESLRDAMKVEHPEYAEVIDRHMSDAVLSKLYVNKTSKKDGTSRRK